MTEQNDQRESVRKLIASHAEIVDFAEYGEGVPADWIDWAETELGIALPSSYKWWLLNYGGGEVGGEEIFSIYEKGYTDVAGGDIVSMHRMDQGRRLLMRNQLAICHSDVDGVFFFDTSAPGSDGEYPVMSAATGTRYADDFLEFLRKRIVANSDRPS